MLDLCLEDQINSGVPTQFTEDILNWKKVTEEGKKNKLMYQMSASENINKQLEEVMDVGKCIRKMIELWMMYLWINKE